MSLIGLLLACCFEAKAGEAGVGVGIAAWRGAAKMELTPALTVHVSLQAADYLGFTIEASATAAVVPAADVTFSMVQARAAVLADLLISRQRAVVRLGLGPAVGFARGEIVEDGDRTTTLLGTAGGRFRGAIDVPFGRFHLVPFLSLTAHRLGVDADVGLALGASW